MCKNQLVVTESTDRRLLTPDDPTHETATVEGTGGSMVADISSSQENLFSALKSEPESPSTGSWLLALGSLTDETAISESLPKSPNGMATVPIRSLHLASRLGCRALEVPRMSPLFEINYRYSGEPAVKQGEAMELKDLLEYLPAKIVDAALHISENRVSVKEHMAELKTPRRLAERGSMP